MTRRTPYLRRNARPDPPTQDTGARAARLSALAALAGAVIGVFGASIPAFVAASSNEKISQESYLRDKRIQVYSEFISTTQRALSFNPVYENDAEAVAGSATKVGLVGSPAALEVAARIEGHITGAVVDRARLPDSLGAADPAQERFLANRDLGEFLRVSREDLGAES